MYNGKTIGVIIPALNEESGLKQILPQMPKFLDQVIVVDNNSTDFTAEVAKRYDCEVVVEPIRGYGQAYKAGAKKLTAEIVIGLDADGQHDPALIQKLLDIYFSENPDCLWTERNELFRKDFIRASGNIVLDITASFLFKFKFVDLQSGMWCMSSNIFKEILPTNNGMSFSQTLKLNAYQRGYKSLLYSIKINPRIGSSKLSLVRDGFLNLIALVRTWISPG